MGIIYDKNVTGPNESNYCGCTIFHDLRGSDVHYSLKRDWSYHKDDVLAPCDPGEGFFCLRVDSMCAAILHSVITPDGERAFHLFRNFLPDNVAYVSLVTPGNGLAHIIVVPFESEDMSFIHDLYSLADKNIGENIFHIDFRSPAGRPVGWHTIKRIDSIQIEIVLPDSFEAVDHPDLINSFHPILRGIMTDEHKPLIPGTHADYFVPHDQSDSFGESEIKVMGIMMSCDGMTLESLVNMFSTNQERMMSILSFLVSRGYCEMDFQGVYRLTSDGRIVFSEAVSRLNRDGGF